MKILHIQSHPDFDNPVHAANMLAQTGLEALQAKFPQAEITKLNLYDPAFPIPRVDKEFLAASNPEKKAIQRQLLDQWKTADLIFIYSPLHNFNVTSMMKDYIDNLLISGETFKYTENGSVGLLSDDDIRVTLVLTSGSDYSKNYKYVNMDLAPHYMRVILALMGINDMTLIRAQGLDIQGNDKAAIIEKTKAELVAHINGLEG